jgi:hypothetical protein
MRPISTGRLRVSGLCARSRLLTPWDHAFSAPSRLIPSLSSEASGSPAPLRYSRRNLSKSNAVSRFSM